MGYRGKTEQREEARRLRAAGMTMPDIAGVLGVSRSSVSRWTRDVPVERGLRRRPVARRPNALERRKQAEIEALLEEGRRRIGVLNDREFLVAGAALYAGEGTKGGGAVCMPNSDARMLVFFLSWLRHFFGVDESRLRVRLYLHEGLDLDAAVAFWSGCLQIPEAQFTSPYRAAADPTIRSARYPMGCPSVRYCCARTHRAVMGVVTALLSCSPAVRGSSIGRVADC